MSGKQSVLLACDFFYPNVGGVEAHLHQLSQCLVQAHHRVCIITHAYCNRVGIRYLTGGVKVYYVPKAVLLQQASCPSLFALAGIMRSIMIRERVSVVHAHTTFSAIAIEAVLHAKTLGVPTVFTDHSLFGFANVQALLSNKLLSFVLHEADHAICVSHTAKENTVLRSGANPERVSVIPNAVDTALFKPSVAAIATQHSSVTRDKSQKRTTVVVLCRLAQRKGVDMLIRIIPEICRRRNDVDFVIGGAGPREGVLRHAWQMHGLTSRVHMLGHVANPLALLDSADVFLNVSLTESFCMAALEAAACGLLVVSTRVGGVPEILPDDMMLLAEPEPNAVASRLEDGINLVRRGCIDKEAMHARMRYMYNWADVSARVEQIYSSVTEHGADGLAMRLRRLYRTGSWYGKLLCCIAICDMLIMQVLRYLQPEHQVDRASNAAACFTPAHTNSDASSAQSEHKKESTVSAEFPKSEWIKEAGGTCSS